MNQFQKFARLPAAKQRLLFRAWLLAGCIHVGLQVFSLPRLRRWVERTRTSATLPPVTAELGMTEQEICWAAGVAARHVPGAACLAEALTAHYLLLRAGYRSRLRIGVRPEGDSITAHAWVELESNAQARSFGVSYTILPL